MDDLARVTLVAALTVNAVLGLGYRVHRLSRGGAVGDVIGQAVLGALLLAIALTLALGVTWTRWVALGYGALFGVVVMPIWTLAVLIPMRPRATDVAFTGVYWGLLLLIVVVALVG